MADIHIQRDHTLGLRAARKIAFAWAEQVEAEYGMECTYEEGEDCDTVAFTRSGVKGTLTVLPDQFDLQRNPSGHVGFGMGIHQCIGQHVARLEAEALLVALTQRFASIAVVGEPRRHHNNTLRAWESLPIALTPA